MEQGNKSPARYGGKWKKWFAVYVTVGAVIYLIVYLAVSLGGGYGG